MARPLQKQYQNGNAYTRPDVVEAAIDAAIRQDLPTLSQHAWVPEPESSDFLPPECLVHLIRDARRRGDEQAMNNLLPPLLTRCDAILKHKVPDGALPNAAELRESILSDFGLLFAEDGSGDHPHELDLFECRFNLAFRTFRIDRFRRERTRLRHMEPMPLDDEPSDASPDKYAFSRLAAAFSQPETQFRDVSLKELVNAIDALPPDERKAVVLCHVLGYKEESEDPSERTAATICGVTGRTIRNRLSRAAAKLSRFK